MTSAKPTDAKTFSKHCALYTESPRTWPLFGRHLDSRPFGLGGKVFYPLRLKFYSEQFKRDAVARYENNEDLSLAAAAAELGVNRASLHQWKKEFDTSKKTRTTVAKTQAESVSDAERIRALEKENGPYLRKVDTGVLIKKHV